MHESSLAKQIVNVALDRAKGARVRAVRGWVAETETLSRESLSLHFAALTQGTLAEGATLDLAITHVEARCRACHATYAPEHHVLICPVCSSAEGEVLGRTGLGIDTVEVEPL